MKAQAVTILSPLVVGMLLTESGGEHIFRPYPQYYKEGGPARIYAAENNNTVVMVDAVPQWTVMLLEVLPSQITKKKAIDVAKEANFGHFASSDALRFICGDISDTNVVLLFNVASYSRERFQYQVC